MKFKTVEVVNYAYKMGIMGGEKSVCLSRLFIIKSKLAKLWILLNNREKREFETI